MIKEITKIGNRFRIWLEEPDVGPIFLGTMPIENIIPEFFAEWQVDDIAEARKIAEELTYSGKEEWVAQPTPEGITLESPAVHGE